MIETPELIAMKLRIFPIAGAVLLTMMSIPVQSQDDFSPGLGIALKASLNGFGGDIVYGLNERLGFRLGAETFSYDRDISFSENDVDYDAVLDARVGSISLLCDLSLSNWFFVTGGAGYSLFKGTFDGEAAGPMPFGDITIPVEMIGDFHFDVVPDWKITPYLGIGFGRPVSAAKTVSFAFELGGFYQGPPDISIQSTGLLSPTSNPDHRHEARLEKQISQYWFFPVMRFNLSFKLVKFD